MTNPNWWSWAIAGLATAGVIARPFDWPEGVWAVAGALALVVLGLMPPALALHAVGEGLDVYLFLAGMMLLSEVGRSEGLFEWSAVVAVNHSRGSPKRLFFLVYAVGITTTTFLSNDATAVVLTPAVLIAARKARCEALPLALVCAFTANAASFVLPISNPANLVLFANHTPSLGAWLRRFALPSAVSVASTCLLLAWSQRQALVGHCEARLEPTPLCNSARIALVGIAATALVLIAVSAVELPLGLPTALAGGTTAIAVTLVRRRAPWRLLGQISWGVLPLVAGLFVLVESLNRSGVTRELAHALRWCLQRGLTAGAAAGGLVVGVASNLTNNLPAGLLASATIARLHPSERVIDALLIGVDLGPNLSVTGSLATILWLNAMRREGEAVSFSRFLRVGAMVMPASLVLTLVSRALEK